MYTLLYANPIVRFNSFTWPLIGGLQLEILVPQLYYYCDIVHMWPCALSRANCVSLTI